MRIKIQVIVFALGILPILKCQAQTADPIFPKGELSMVQNHTGNIWLKELVVGDDTFDPALLSRLMTLAQSWIGISIQAVRSS